MVRIKVSLPNPDAWPLQIFLFARWAQEHPPAADTAASWKDLKYYLRAMRGPHWKMTVPLCVHDATEQDVQKLETDIAYMETSFCARWFYPMEAWTATRVLLIIVHAWASGDARLQPFDWEGFRDLIPHVTPYTRTPQPCDMAGTVAGLARLAKEFFPLEIFHYRQIYDCEHWIAVSRMFDLATWKDAATQCDPTELLDGAEDAAVWEIADLPGERPGSEVADGYDSEVDQAEDPRDMAASAPLGSADVYLMSTTRTNPPIFEACTVRNADVLDYCIRVAHDGVELTVPLPLNGLRPTDGPIIRLLLAFLRSRAFARFHVSPTAHDTILTILCALWAFWSDLNGIPPGAYTRFCARLVALMPQTRPDGGDMTADMSGFITWVRDELRGCALRYRPIGDTEIQDAVQQLYGIRVALFVKITAHPENADGGRDAHEYYYVRMNNRTEGSRGLLQHFSSPPQLSDLESVDA
ncbi:hypothetical protein LXA43DRAFT_1132082 [Ganoderma leucocontextum]|nr:hypothetical protein LXA43DRAFT_1132082 [Ganoderma leucocontextum]